MQSVRRQPTPRSVRTQNDVMSSGNIGRAQWLATTCTRIRRQHIAARLNRAAGRQATLLALNRVNGALCALLSISIHSAPWSISDGIFINILSGRNSDGSPAARSSVLARDSCICGSSPMVPSDVGNSAPAPCPAAILRDLLAAGGRTPSSNRNRAASISRVSLSACGPRTSIAAPCAGSVARR